MKYPLQYRKYRYTKWYVMYRNCSPLPEEDDLFIKFFINSKPLLWFFFFFQILLGSLCSPLSMVPQLQATCTADVHHSWLSALPPPQTNKHTKPNTLYRCQLVLCWPANITQPFKPGTWHSDTCGKCNVELKVEISISLSKLKCLGGWLWWLDSNTSRWHNSPQSELTGNLGAHHCILFQTVVPWSPLFLSERTLWTIEQCPSSVTQIRHFDSLLGNNLFKKINNFTLFQWLSGGYFRMYK